MEQLFFAGKAYLKINSLVKTPLHEFMAVERSGLWAPDRNKSRMTTLNATFDPFVGTLTTNNMSSCTSPQ